MDLFYNVGERFVYVSGGVGGGYGEGEYGLS